MYSPVQAPLTARGDKVHRIVDGVSYDDSGMVYIYGAQGVAASARLVEVLYEAEHVLIVETAHSIYMGKNKRLT